MTNVMYLIFVIAMVTQLTVCGWNVRSLGSIKPYLRELSEDADILFLAEHRLYDKELHKLYDLGINYDVYMLRRVRIWTTMNKLLNQGTVV